MSSLRQKRFYTLEEYFSLVKNSDERYEYWHGEIFLMSGASPEHVFITDNVLNSLSRQLSDRNCRAMSSDIRLKVPTAPPFRYADISVACGKLEFEEIDGLKSLVNPIMLVEVLSTSTERFDRHKKFEFYKSIESFREYLLITQNQPSITQYIKQGDGTWQGNEVIGLDSQIHLPSIDCTLRLSEVYQDVL
jgi:Uma2 family endonuclease